MANRQDSIVAATNGVLQFMGAGTNYLVQTPAGVLYVVYVDQQADLTFRKSTDGGRTFSTPVNIFVGSITNLSVWYDRWSNIAAGLIHIAYTESGADDTLYRTIDTESADALSTQTTIFAGASTSGAGMLSIARAVGGNVYCRTTIDGGTEGGFFRLPNANVPNGAWDAARTIDEALGTTDQMILLPDYDAADMQDMLAIFWDASANEISRKLYDDSANAWAETSIATSMLDGLAAVAFPHFAVAMDIANTRHILVAWSAIDALDADLRCWTIDSGAITEVTNVVLNSTDNQGLCGICLDLITGRWTVYYAGKSDGSETFYGLVNVYSKTSTDQGTTWGPETQVTLGAREIQWLATCPRMYLGPATVWFHSDVPAFQNYNELFMSVSTLVPRAGHQLLGG